VHGVAGAGEQFHDASGVRREDRCGQIVVVGDLAVGVFGLREIDLPDRLDFQVGPLRVGCLETAVGGCLDAAGAAASSGLCSARGPRKTPAPTNAVTKTNKMN
jgi:hypothetical protein